MSCFHPHPALPLEGGGVHPPRHSLLVTRYFSSYTFPLVTRYSSLVTYRGFAHAIRPFRRRQKRIRHHPPRHPAPGATTWAPPNTGPSSLRTPGATASINPPPRAGLCGSNSTPSPPISPAATFTCAIRTAAITGPSPGSRSPNRWTNTRPPPATAPATRSSPRVRLHRIAGHLLRAAGGQL